MVVLFEIARPFRRVWKVERFGPLVRFIWGWFSFAYISADFNDVARAIRQDERERMGAHADVVGRAQQESDHYGVP